MLGRMQPVVPRLSTHRRARHIAHVQILAQAQVVQLVLSSASKTTRSTPLANRRLHLRRRRRAAVHHLQVPYLLPPYQLRVPLLRFLVLPGRRHFLKGPFSRLLNAESHAMTAIWRLCLVVPSTSGIRLHPILHRAQASRAACVVLYLSVLAKPCEKKRRKSPRPMANREKRSSTVPRNTKVMHQVWLLRRRKRVCACSTLGLTRQRITSRSPRLSRLQA